MLIIGRDFSSLLQACDTFREEFIPNLCFLHIILQMSRGKSASYIYIQSFRPSPSSLLSGHIQQTACSAGVAVATNERTVVKVSRNGPKLSSEAPENLHLQFRGRTRASASGKWLREARAIFTVPGPQKLHFSHCVSKAMK